MRNKIIRHVLFSITLFLSALLIFSCARTIPYPPLDISTDRRVIEVIQDRFAHIKTLNATLSLRTASPMSPELTAYLFYKNDGLFKLVGLTPSGFTLFSFETTYHEFTLILPDGRKIIGNVGDFVSEFKEISGVSLPADPGMVREAMDFYGSSDSQATSFLIEEFGDYSLLSQLRNDKDISYPLKRWWINKPDMTVVRKELFSTLQDRRGERLFEVLYRDFRIVDNIPTPFEIVIKGKEGKNLLEMKFNKIEYNR